MILLFKAGWFRWIFGVLFLFSLLFCLHHLRGERTPLFLPLSSPRYWTLALPVWVAAGVTADLVLGVCYLALGVILIPRHFLRWTLTSASRLFGTHRIPLILAGGLMAGLLEEPIFRWEIQPLLISEMGLAEGVIATAALFAAFHWNPMANLLTLWAFPRSILFSYLFIRAKNPLVPVLVHALGDCFFLYLIASLERYGLTHLPPEESTRPR
jgi:membrane protease YdiL (CAAX protease family)